MKITIAQRLHPFSHQMGTKFLLPNTSWSVQVFPTRLFFSDLEKGVEPLFFAFDFTGPIDDFTAELDLEKGHLSVFGKTQKGYMRYQLFVKEEGIWLHLEKAPEEKVVCRSSLAIGNTVLNKGDQICLVKQASELKLTQERLSLGMHKAQDWDLVRRRLDLKEIFPQWFLMASSITAKKTSSSDLGNYSLLKICKEKIQRREKEGVLQAFESLFCAAFEGVLVPRVWDLDYQGIIAETAIFNDFISPLPLFARGW